MDMYHLGNIKANNKNILVARYQTTGQIAGAIVRAVKESQPTAEKLKKYFQGDKYQQAKLIFIFCKNLLPYKKESASRQTARTMNRIIQDAKKGGDCKHFSTLSASLCKALNIKCKLRLISQRYDNDQPNHIYTVALINGREVIIDAVLPNFDTEARYNKKFDININ